MRIPQEFYDEDQKIKQERVERIDKEIKGGTFEQGPGDKRYSPQGIKVWESHDENK